MRPTLTGIRFYEPSPYAPGGIQFDWSNDRHERVYFDSLTHEDVVIGVHELLRVLIRDEKLLCGEYE